MPCSLRTSPLRTKDARAVCGKTGKTYNVSGALAGLSLELYAYHRRRLESLGLKVTEIFSLAKEDARHTRKKRWRKVAQQITISPAHTVDSVPYEDAL